MTPTQADSMILEALLTRLQLLELTPELPINMPGQTGFEPPEDRRYLRVQLMRNDTVRLFINSDGPHQFLGILQLTLVSGEDRSELAIAEEAGKIAAHFGADTKMIVGEMIVRSTKYPTIGDTYPDVKVTSDVLTPISVEYESYF